MPRYKVLKEGFMNNTLCKPGHPRHGFVNTDKPLKPVPSWLEPVKAETAAQKKAREKQAEADAEQVAEDKKGIAGASFMNNPGEKVETLG